MSQSPSQSPSIPNSNLPSSAAARRLKRPRTNITGRPLALPRLLETLTAEEMRSLLKQICDRRPEIGAEVVAAAPRPSVQSVLENLNRYEAVLRQSFPVGSPTSEYAYNRVRQPLLDMYEALKDYTPHFLPPNEVQPNVSLNFLDEVTAMLHRMPNWESYHNNRHKAEAYEEMAKAWALVIREAAKKGAGIQLQYQGWDNKLAKHNDMSGGKMEEAMNELRTSLGWIGRPATGQSQEPSEASSIRQQLLSGTYGQTVRVGPW
jgi:protein Cut8